MPLLISSVNRTDHTSNTLCHFFNIGVVIKLPNIHYVLFTPTHALFHKTMYHSFKLY